MHCGHSKRTKNEAKLSLRNMDDETLSAVSEMLFKHCPTALANQFFQSLNGGHLTTRSINSLSNCVLVRKHGPNSDETTAETLIRFLTINDDIEHVIYVVSHNEDFDLVKVHKQRKSIKNGTEQDVDYVPGDAK